MNKTKFPGIGHALIGMLLLFAGNNALAFTLPVGELLTPGASITDSDSLNSQIEPLTGAIQSHLRNLARGAGSNRSARRDSLYASNLYASQASDAYFLDVAAHGGGPVRTLWLNSTFSAFDNDFARTRYDGGLHLLLGGFDYTVDDRFVYGIAVSYERSNITTHFNSGGQEIEGYGITPYFAYLFSDSWSLDLSLGVGQSDTDQFRTVGDPAPPLTNRVTSDFESTRGFVAANLTYSAPWRNWYLTAWLGVLDLSKEQDDYDESGFTATSVAGKDLDNQLWTLGAEAAFGFDASETYIGVIFEKIDDLEEIEFTSGQQPANDDDSALLTLGWRYFGNDVTADVEFSTRVGKDEASENSISTTLRVEL